MTKEEKEKQRREKEAVVTDDIVKQLESISLLTTEHLRQKGLIDHADSDPRKKPSPSIDRHDKVHTLHYKDGVLKNSSSSSASAHVAQNAKKNSTTSVNKTSISSSKLFNSF